MPEDINEAADDLFGPEVAKEKEESKEVEAEVVTDALAPTVATPQTQHIIKHEEVTHTAALEPHTMELAWKLAHTLHSSGLFGQFRNPQSVLAVLMRGRSLGIDSVAALETMNVIEGKTSMSATLMIGLCVRSEVCEYFDLVETDDTKATWETKRKGSKNPTRLSFTIEEADRMGLLKPSRSGRPTNWERQPNVMLRWRAGTSLARLVYPDIVSGIYSDDEIASFGS